MSSDEDPSSEPVESARRSGLFGPRPVSEEPELASPSVASLYDAIEQIESAIDLGAAGDDLEYFVRSICARCFPGRAVAFFLDDTPDALPLSREAARRHGVSTAMLEESGIESSDEYILRYGASEAGFDVPILAEGKLVGVLALEYPFGCPVLPDDREALALLARALGGALARSRASDESRRLLEQLRHLQRLATIGQLTASITHELNHPLTTVSVYADLLLRRAEDAGRDEWETLRLARISAAAERMQSFTRDLVHYSRPTAKERSYEHPQELIERALSVCEPIVAAKEAKLSVEVDEDVGALFCVPSQLEQVLVNLVVNAAHAVKPADGTIRVLAQREPGWVKITVEDDGPGVPEPQRAAVFDAFYSTKPADSGTGLGLSIVQRIVEEHGGDITVRDSALGGACFEVRLPSGRSG